MKKKENKEIATAQMAHLVFTDTQSNAEKTKRAISFPSHKLYNIAYHE